MDRRTFLKSAVAGAGAVAVGARPDRARAANLALPSHGLETRPSRTPVQHLVVVMMENRSVDHYLGWYGSENPDFDAIQDASFPDRRVAGEPLVATEPWGQRGRGNFHGQGFADPSHDLGVAPTATEGSDLHRLAELGWFDGLPVRTDWRFEDSFLHARPELLAEVSAALVGGGA